MIDTGNGSKSTARYGQYTTYYKTIGHEPINKSVLGKSFKFGIGLSKSYGTTKITSLIRDIEFYVIDADTLFLISLNDIDRLKV